MKLKLQVGKLFYILNAYFDLSLPPERQHKDVKKLITQLKLKKL